jgi:CRP-like cAMP-binding protein
MALMTTRPYVAMRWLVSLTARLAVSQDRLEELLAGPLGYQLGSMLLHLCCTSAAPLLHLCGAEGGVAVSQQTISYLLGSQRPGVFRSLANLERRGFMSKQ